MRLAAHHIPGNSLLHRLDARAKLLSLLLLSAAVLLSTAPWGHVAALGLLALIVRLSKLPSAATLAPLKALWKLFLVIFLMNAFFYATEQPLLSWGIVHLTEAGMRQGLKVVFNVAYIMLLAQLLTRTTPPMALTAGLCSVLRPLKWLRVPVEEVAMVVGIALRFIPTLLEEADTLKKAHTARGARFESPKLTERLGSFFPLFTLVFLAAFRRADELATAMEARGYRNARSRTPKAKAPLGRADMAALACSACVCLAQMYCTL